MITEKQKNPPKYILPDILGFDQLITGLEETKPFDRSETEEVESSDVLRLKIRRNKQPLDYGIPFGATLLISGPPGAGKTTFALEIARGLMRFPPLFQDSLINGFYEPQIPLIFYISPEIDSKRLKTMFAAMGWFKNVNGLFRTDDPIPDHDTFYTVVPQPEVDRPVPSPEELVNSIFSRISKAISPSDAPREPRPVVVIVDSVTSLLKGCATQSEERRQTHEMLHRLRSLFGNDHLALTILLAEQTFIEKAQSEIPSVEDYLAEIVFRLSLKSAPLGRRIRALEVVKSQGVHMMLGEHSWAIVTNKLAGEILALR